MSRPWLIRRPQFPATPEPSKAKPYTNEQLIERFDTFLLVSGKAERTRVAYKEALTQFDRFLGGQGLTTIKTQDIRAFLSHLRNRNFQQATIAAVDLR